MVTKAELDKALDSWQNQFEELCTTTNRSLEEFFERQAHQFAQFEEQAQMRDAHTQASMVRDFIQHLQITQDNITLSIREDMNNRLAEMDSKLDQMRTDCWCWAREGSSPSSAKHKKKKTLSR
jgi:hypothetical protein